MDADTVAMVQYSVVGLILTIFVWPFFRGRWGDVSMTGGSDLLHLLMLTLIWPLLIVAGIYLGFHYYKNSWIDYLMLRDKKKAAALRQEFDERWSTTSAADREKFGYEGQKASMETLAKSFETTADKRFYRLEQQARKGLWFNPYDMP